MIAAHDVVLTTTLPPRTHRARAARPFAWSVRRELWENPWLWSAPTGAAVVLLLLYTVMIAVYPGRVMHLVGSWAARPAELFAHKDHFSASMLLLAVGMLVSASYSIRALQGERRDRSILFWKSLPVSDAATVLAKACIPLVVVPALTAVLVLATQLAMLLVASARLLPLGGDAGAHWAHFPLATWPVVLYFLVAPTLLHAPIHAWLLLASAWAKRAAFLWAMLPPLAIVTAEWLATGGSRFGSELLRRAIGFAFDANAVASSTAAAPRDFPPLAPLHLTSPRLWIGLAFAALCLAGAVHIRRRRDPA
jgi:ABC-2 type transport system permease protein